MRQSRPIAIDCKSRKVYGAGAGFSPGYSKSAHDKQTVGCMTRDPFVLGSSRYDWSKKGP